MNIFKKSVLGLPVWVISFVLLGFVLARKS